MLNNPLIESADKGDPESQYLLGTALLAGDGCTADAGKAAEWFSRSAEQGYAPAKRELAMMHLTGDGADPVAAYTMMSEAAKGMDPNAMYNLAIMYERGIGVKQDLYESLKLLAYAAEMNCPGAEQDAERVSSMISEGRCRNLRSRPLLHLDISDVDVEAACCKDMLELMLNGSVFLADTYQGPELIGTDENGAEEIMTACPSCGKKIRRVRHDKVY